MASPNPPMDTVGLFLVLLAGLLLLGIVAEGVFRRTGLPDVLVLFAAGVVLGPVTGLAPRDRVAEVAPYLGGLTIVIVLFEGGMALRLSDIGKASGRAALLAVTGFALSAVVVAALSMTAASADVLPEDWTWTHGLTLGAIVGGSSSVVVMPALRTSRTPPALANLLGVESALTDVLCIVVTTACVRVLVEGVTSPGDIAGALLGSLSIGLGVGGAVGALSIVALRALNRDEHAHAIVLSALFILYFVTGALGGSAPLAILAAAVMVGNARYLARLARIAEPVSLSRTVRGVHGQIAFLVKTFFFTFMGLMLAPPWSLIAFGGVLGVGLLVARVPAVGLATIGMGLDRRGKVAANACLPRGMAAGVMASVPAAAGITALSDAPVAVFATVASTILLFAAGFSVVRRMSGEESDPEDAGHAEHASGPAPDPAPDRDPDPEPVAQGA